MNKIYNYMIISLVGYIMAMMLSGGYALNMYLDRIVSVFGAFHIYIITKDIYLKCNSVYFITRQKNYYDIFLKGMIEVLVYAFILFMPIIINLDFNNIIFEILIVSFYYLLIYILGLLGYVFLGYQRGITLMGVIHMIVCLLYFFIYGNGFSFVLSELLILMILDLISILIVHAAYRKELLYDSKYEK